MTEAEVKEIIDTLKMIEAIKRKLHAFLKRSTHYETRTEVIDTMVAAARADALKKSSGLTLEIE